ncbi:MAG: recombinase family protein [Rhodospirillales bacterium]|nr:recombinase family protein [Rhodospirillales bacterium]
MKTDSQKLAVIYCRVSDPKQASIRGDGLHSQERTCRDYALRNNYEVIEVFTDTQTGGDMKRPGLVALRAYLKKHKGLIVIVDHTSRLSRDLLDYLLLREELRNRGVKLECPSMPLTDTAAAQLMDKLVATFSDYHRHQNAEQTLSRMKARMLNGYSVFQAPIGYEYRDDIGPGKILAPVEPLATIIRQALEGFAWGTLETQADVVRFLESQPHFPKDRYGRVRHQRVTDILRQPLYAGYLEHKKWDISLRPAQHKEIVSFETWMRVQEKLDGKIKVPRKKNIAEDFPLRGHVVCADCGTPLTSCWSKGMGGRYAYYLCPKRGCESYGKSTRREILEGEFEELLKTVQPSEGLFKLASAMFADIWAYRLTQAQAGKKALAAKLLQVEKDITQYTKQILNVRSEGAIQALDTQIDQLHAEKILIQEKMAKSGEPARSFDDALRTALLFLGNPWKLWSSGQLSDRQTVLKLVFPQRLEYVRNSGLRTPILSLPFKLLADISGGENKMARPRGFEPLTF